MRKLGKFFGYTLVFVLLVLFFLPKRQLYYEAEKLLQKEGIVLSGEQAHDTGLGLTVTDGSLYFKDLRVAQLNAISVTPLLLYNSISVTPFRLSPAMKSFLPESIEGVTVRYTVFDPLHIVIEAEGAFGSLSGTIGLADRKIGLDLVPSKELRSLRPFWLKEFKPTKEGGYRYDSTY